MPAPYVHKTIFWAKSEFVEYVSIDKFGGRPKRTSPRENVKVVQHFIEPSKCTLAADASVLDSAYRKRLRECRMKELLRGLTKKRTPQGICVLTAHYTVEGN